ncbi:hypothetical protein [Priestia aryabhattai]|uniref:hypothetical protein n=1 Tax=Priestia aryabhattai TaxID=412384 RepID=UPI003CE6FF96
MEQEIDPDKVYDYAEFPDKVSGRCDNCNLAYFKSSVTGGVFLRECRECGSATSKQFESLVSVLLRLIY